MKIHLPNSAFIGNIDPFLRSFTSSHSTLLEITTNQKWISVHPVVLCMVAALGLTMKPSQIECQKLEAASKHYLERMGLFALLGISSGIKVIEHEPSGRFIPLTRITHSEELSRFMNEMVPLMHLQPKEAETIKYVMSELIRNVLEHAQSPRGAIVAAQYYQKSNIIRIGVADTGVGIRETIRASHPVETHLQALRLALKPGITGTTRREGGTEYNAGAGLFLIKSIATVNRNFFMIYSGNALYKLLKSKRKAILHADPFEDRHTHGEDFPFWQGTVVGIDISLDQTQEFSLLLDLIWETYIKEVRERKKAKYRRPRFL